MCNNKTKEKEFANNTYQCPYNGIVNILSSPRTNCDSRLTKLWTEFIGKKVFVDTSAVKNAGGNLLKLVLPMFTTDPIAYRLMKELILYKPNIEKILVKQDFSRVDLKGNPSLLGLKNFLQNTAKYPVLVLERKSNYAAIISTNSESDNIIDLYFWYFGIGGTLETNKPEEYDDETSIDELWEKFSLNKIIIDKTTSVQTKNVQEVLNSMLKDPIKNSLIHEIMHYKSEVDEIHVKQNYFPQCSDKQNIAEMTLILKMSSLNPVLILEHGSSYAAIITANTEKEKSMILHIWDLGNCI